MRQEDIDELRLLRRKVRNIKGPNVRHTRDSIYILPSATPQRSRSSDDPASDVALLRISNPEDGGGQYTMWVVDRPDSVGSSDDAVSDDDLGTVSETTVRGLNVREKNRDTHDLTLVEGDRPKDFIGYFLGTDDDGVDCYAFDGAQWEDCDPEDEADVDGGTF